MFAAINAASIKIVPEPQKGSKIGDFLSHFAKRKSPAANTSFIGASPTSSLYPLWYNGTPLVFNDSVTTSLLMYKSNSTCGRLISTSGRSL